MKRVWGLRVMKRARDLRVMKRARDLRVMKSAKTCVWRREALRLCFEFTRIFIVCCTTIGDYKSGWPL
jgi:hypothetical protein